MFLGTIPSPLVSVFLILILLLALLFPVLLLSAAFLLAIIFLKLLFLKLLFFALLLLLILLLLNGFLSIYSCAIPPAPYNIRTQANNFIIAVRRVARDSTINGSHLVEMRLLWRTKREMFDVRRSL
jgi:hypothetical protein